MRFSTTIAKRCTNPTRPRMRGEKPSSFFALIFLDEQIARIETSASLFPPGEEDDHQHDDRNDLETRERPGVSDVIAKHVLDGVRRRGDEDPRLICETGHQSADRVQRERVEM